MTDLPAQVQRLLDEAVAAGMGSAASAGWVELDGARQVVFSGRRCAWRGPAEAREAALGAPIDRESIYDLASLTKPMATTTLLAQLVDQGVVDLDHPVERYWPMAQGTVMGPLSLRSLLGHGSGAIAWRDYFQLTIDAPQRRAAVQRAVLHQPLERAPGARAVYSDLGFLVLGWTLEHVLQTPLRDAFARRVAAPMALPSAHFPGMHPGLERPYVATEIWPPRAPQNRPLVGVVHDDNCAALAGVAGHAGLFGGVDDVLIWAEHWLRAAVGERARCDAAPSAEVARQWLTSAAAPETTWRLGFDTPSRPTSTAGSLASDRAFGHLGFTGTSVWICPARKVAVTLLTNRVHPTRERVEGIRALRPLLHDTIWSWFDHR